MPYEYNPDEYRIFTYATDDTALYSEGDLPSWVTRVVTVYAFRAFEATHICSFVPSSYMIPYRVYLYGECPDYIAESAWEAERDDLETELMQGEANGDYFGYVDVNKVDPRLIAENFTITKSDLETYMEENDCRDLDSALWDMVQEEFCNGMNEPAFVNETVAAAMDAERHARRMTASAETLAWLSRFNPCALAA